MSRLLRRIRPARAEPDAPSAAPDPAAGDVVVDEPRPSLPAGVAPEELIGDPPDTRRRGRLRRRLRHLRQVRELMLRDVGGLVYEFHRAGAGSAPGEPGAPLVSHKLDRLTALDKERRALEAALDDQRAETVLREPGVGGVCPACGEYFASDARFCSRCGARVDGRVHAENDSSRDETAGVPAQGAASAVAQAGAPARDREGARS
jgi:hypothetical protein